MADKEESMKNKKLSPLMQDAYNVAQKSEGKIYRLPGGFWYFNKKYEGSYIGTTTVEALVSRGLATYTEWKEGRRGKFPIEVTVAEKGSPKDIMAKIPVIKDKEFVDYLKTL